MTEENIFTIFGTVKRTWVVNVLNGHINFTVLSGNQVSLSRILVLLDGYVYFFLKLSLGSLEIVLY